jgi:uroporphyrinogen III methyltransferase/synthase
MTNQHSAERKTGIAYLVGAGPGDPGLLTLRGRQCLERADVLIYDYLAPQKLLAFAPPEAEKIYVGKKAGRHTLKQKDINRLLVEKTLGRHTVVRLKGGDPFVFGRGGEEALALKEAGCRFEVVPGVTAGIAAPCYAGIPVTHRGSASSMALITGHEDPAKTESSISWEHLAKGVDTLVFYMGVGNLPNITRVLIEGGRSPDTPVAVVRWGTTPRQRTVSGTLSTIADIVKKEAISPPAITIVGDVVNHRDNLAWFESRPLFGRTIINTRSRRQASALTGWLEELGARVLEMPTIDITPAGRGSELEKTMANLAKYDWIVFTSPNGVESFFSMLRETRGDVRALANARIASIGPATGAAIGKYCVRADVTASRAVAEGLIEELEKHGPWKGKKVLAPRAAQARDILPETLRKWGACVDIVTAYTTSPAKDANPETLTAVEKNAYDIITFTSSSTVTGFIALLGEKKFRALNHTLKAASIGPVTTKTMRDAGIEPMVVAREHTIDGLVEAVKEHCRA